MKKGSLINSIFLGIMVLVWLFYDKLKEALPNLSQTLGKIESIIAILLPFIIVIFAINTYKDFKHKTLSKNIFILFEVIYMGYFIMLGIVSISSVISLLYGS